MKEEYNKEREAIIRWMKLRNGKGTAPPDEKVDGLGRVRRKLCKTREANGEV